METRKRKQKIDNFVIYKFRVFVVKFQILIQSILVIIPQSMDASFA